MGSIVVAGAMLAAGSRTGRRSHRSSGQVVTALRFGLVDLRRNPRNASFWFPEVHAGTMTPTAIASLAALAGLFVVIDAAARDGRLRLAGYRASVMVAARLGVVAVAVVVITVAALAVTATVFR